MEDGQKSLLVWIKEHKKALVLAGISITAIIVAVLLTQNSVLLMEMGKALRQTIGKSATKSQIPAALTTKASLSPIDINGGRAAIDSTLIKRAPHEVSEHIRNLPQGYRASPSKLSMAAEKGLELMEGQTFVSSYRTGNITA